VNENGKLLRALAAVGVLTVVVVVVCLAVTLSLRALGVGR
jgi:hypothetical protein